MSEKENLHPWLVSELHSSLQRSNQDSQPLFFGEDSISAPIVAVSVRLQCRQCGAHAYSPVSTQLDKAILENIDIDKEILENIDIDKEILENIDKISNRLEFGISNIKG